MLRIIYVGKPQAIYAEVFAYFARRIGSLLKVKLIEVREGRGESVEKKLEEERRGIEKHLRGKVYLTTPRGKMISDADMLRIIKESMYQDVTIVVGSAYGISQALRGEEISFSKLTFPHDLFLIILLEQVYRQALAIKGTRYKK
ncbi:MAG: 23S rRNA (pseudouridine(1915)-N(3))-methyltransferase RlmH [Candidatus Methanospirareceae archaeon]